MIKLITFDLDDTLWPIHDVIKHASVVMQSWVHENYPVIGESFPSYDFSQIQNELCEEFPELIGDLTQLRKKTFQHAAIKSGIPQTEAMQLSEEAFDIFFAERNKVTFFPHALQLLIELAQDYSLIAISNGNADLNVIGIQQYFLAHYKAGEGIPAKPKRMMFDMALEKAKAKAFESVHIGDSFECDVQAAHQLGFHTIYTDMFNSNNPKALALASASVNTLDSIPNIIRSL